MAKPQVLIMATLDTKDEETLYVREVLQAQGVKALIIDCGSLGTPPPVADITRQEVARRAGVELAELVATGDKGHIIGTMGRGLSLIVEDMHQAGELQGVIGLGGGQGTAMGTGAMQSLPLGFPKVMATTLAAGNMRPFLGTKDIAVFPSVADILGMNFILRRTLYNAALCLAAMVQSPAPTDRAPGVVIGATAFGVVTAGLLKLRKLLVGPKLEMAFFHANGMGGAALDEFTAQGAFDAILHWSTHEITERMAGGIFQARPEHLDVLAEKRLPCLVSMGAVDYFCMGPHLELTEEWKKRRNYIVHNRNITLVRANAEEMVGAAEFLAAKLNKALGPVKVMVPLRGFSEPNAKGKQFYDPEADAQFLEALERQLAGHIDIIKLDSHINSDEFVAEAAKEMRDMLAAEATA